MLVRSLFLFAFVCSPACLSPRISDAGIAIESRGGASKVSERVRAGVATDFEIFQKLEIMRMISSFLPNLRLSAAGTPELRIAAHAHGYRMSAL